MVLVVPIEGLNAVGWTLASTAICLTFGRFYIRWRKIGRLELDDLLNALALASLLCFMATYQAYLPIQYAYQLFSLGLGGHDASESQLLYIQNLNTANIVFFWITIYLVKATFLSMYWLVFNVSRKFRIAWSCVAAYTLISFLATFFGIFWDCGTPDKIKNVEACNSTNAQTILALEVMWCALNTFGDVLTMLLPLWMLRKIRLSRGKKIGLISIAVLVIIDILFDILRTVYTIGSYAADFPNANAVWALCEPTIAVMVCALPTYRALLSRSRPEQSSSYSNLRKTGDSRKTASQKSHVVSTSHEMDDMNASMKSDRAILEPLSLQAV